ncbi:hypothetical protein EDD85DRAFT_952416 [Armillaria nabsnona]|nr:hypothetical protein EDD85DRAFT_952416 [Armillaria nabsnona]
MNLRVCSLFTIPHKHAWHDDGMVEVKDKPAAKKPKLKETSVIDEDKPAVATKVVHKHGPGPSKLLPVTLGISGEGFGEKVPSSAKDFGAFVEVDKSYWSKAIAPFVGEWYTTACDHCRHLGMQCCKLLMHTVKCVNGVAALNPVEHYRPKGYDAVNSFESALNAIEANSTTISLVTQQYLAGLSVLAHTNSICAQTFNLRRCLTPVEEEEEDNDGEGEKYEAPSDVAEGESGPSRQQKHRSG